MAERAAWVVVGAVVFVWITTTLVFPFFVKGYTPPPSVGTVMGSLAGGAAAYLFARRANENGKKKPTPKSKPTSKKEGSE